MYQRCESDRKCVTVFSFSYAIFALRNGLKIMLKNMLDSVTHLMYEETQKYIYDRARSLSNGLIGAVTALWLELCSNKMKSGWCFGQQPA